MREARIEDFLYNLRKFVLNWKRSLDERQQVLLKYACPIRAVIWVVKATHKNVNKNHSSFRGTVVGRNKPVKHSLAAPSVAIENAGFIYRVLKTVLRRKFRSVLSEKRPIITAEFKTKLSVALVYRTRKNQQAVGETERELFVLG